MNVGKFYKYSPFVFLPAGIFPSDGHFSVGAPLELTCTLLPLYADQITISTFEIRAGRRSIDIQPEWYTVSNVTLRLQVPAEHVTMVGTFETVCKDNQDARLAVTTVRLQGG